MADNFGPGGVYGNIPRLDSHGRSQIPMFLRWNPDPVGNDAKNLSGLNPDLQKVVAQARADNPKLNFVIGNGRRAAQDQDQAKAWGWSRVGSQDGGDANVHMQGNAVDLWGLDSNGRVQFDPGQQKQIAQAMQSAAAKLGVGVNWGGNFKSFKDAPHFELSGGGSAASSGAPEGPTSTSAAPASQPSASSSAAPSSPSQPTPGTTLNSNVIDTLSRNIASIESGGAKNPYDVLQSRTGAVGKYQVMPFNVGPWTQQALGHAETPDEFRKDTAAQEAVFRDQASRALKTMSPADFASTWFTGKPYSQASAGASDYTGTTNRNYVARATAGIDNAFTPGATVTASGGPTPPAGGSAAAPVTGQPGQPSGGLAGSLPGFTANSPGAKMTAQGLQALAGGGGGSGDEPPPMPSMQMPQAQAMGGPMMMRPGGQNIDARTAAMNALAQQGFLMQPTLTAFGGNSTRSPVPTMMPGQATGMPSMPGTTLNSPSQLQTALMTGSMSPYDIYANAALGGGGGLGSV